MDSRIFGVLILVLFFSLASNVFSEGLLWFYMDNVRITTIENPEGGPNGPSPIGAEAYYRDYAPGHQIIEGEPDPDWILLEFDLTNYSTSDSGDPHSVYEFSLNINTWRVSTQDYRLGNSIYYSWEQWAENRFTDAQGPFWYYDNGYKIHYAIPMPADHINNLTAEYKVVNLDVSVAIESPDYKVLYIESTPDNPSWNYPNLEVHDPYYEDPDPVEFRNDLNIYLDPVTCVDKTTGGPGPVPHPDPEDPFGANVINCIDLAYDQNRLYYEIAFIDANEEHVSGEGGYYVKVEDFYLECRPTSIWTGRTLHYSRGCHPIDGVQNCLYGELINAHGQYEGFPPTCEFLHYDVSTAPPYPFGHTDCKIYQEEVPSYSAPPDFVEVPNCGDPQTPACPPTSSQNKNVFYNANTISLRKYLNPDEFKLYFDDPPKIFTGTLKIDSAGGNFYCMGSATYSVYDSTDTVVYGPVGKSIYTGGSNSRLYESDSPWDQRPFKLGGHDAYIIRESFMPTTTNVRPLIDWVVELPIRNYGSPWDGVDDLGNPSEKDVLYAEVNVINPFWDIETRTISIGGDDSDFPVLNTDEQEVFFVPFNISKGIYRFFLTAASMDAKLYDSRGWIHDYAFDKPVANLRLLSILHPVVYAALGDECFTNPGLEYACWYSVLPYLAGFGQVDLNANKDINFVLRLRNPFDFNEFFDLTYETDASTNARLEFYPERNFVAPYTEGRYGYKYAIMTLKNPRLIHGDANYNIVGTSVGHPFVWDDVEVQFRSFVHNLKIESFEITNKLDPGEEKYSLGEELEFELVIRNTGDSDETDVNFLVVSSMDPTVIFHAGEGISIPAGEAVTIVSAPESLPAISSKGVFVVQASVGSVMFESDVSDNDAVIIIETEYLGDLSNLSETNYFLIVVVAITVLFVVRKK